MILITKIEYAQTDKNIAQVHAMAMERLYEPPFGPVPIGDKLLEPKMVIETIHGRRFINGRTGEDVVIGITQEIGKLLGLEYEAFENLQTDRKLLQCKNDTLTQQYNSAMSELNNIKQLGFFKRLLRLFKGY